MEYGTGAIMACPAHDQRDFDFATKYGLPIVRVVARDRPTRPTRRSARGRGRRRRAGQFAASSTAWASTTAKARGDRPRRSRRLGRGQDRLAPARLGRHRASATGARRSRSSIATPAAWCRCRKDQLPVVLPEDVDFDDPGQSARCATRPGSTSPARSAAARRARDRHARHLRQFELVLPALRQPAGRQAVRPREVASAGCRSTSISAASSMRSCTCSTPASGRARSRTSACSTSTEPFASLFTQGMVTHETYRSTGNDPRWLAPEEVELRGGEAVEKATGLPVEIGRVVKMSKSKKNMVDPDEIVAQLRRRRGALVHALRQPARARPAVVGSGHRGLLALRPAPVAAVRRSSTPAATGEDKALARKTHQTIAAVGDGHRGARLQQGGRADLRADQRDREGRALGRPQRGDPRRCCCSSRR